MEYSNLTTESKVSFKRYTHTSRHIKCSNLVTNLKYKNLLDFGSGDGKLFEFLKIYPQKKYFAYEPYKKLQKQFLKNNTKFKNIKLIESKKNLKKNFYDVITINEVFEHLPNKKILEVIKTLKYIAKSDSTLIISVPIEVGLSSLVKNIIRIVFRSTHERTTLKNLIRSIFQRKIIRGKKPFIESHIGFNHNDLKKILNNHFSIIKITYSPFGFLKSILNSQIFFICKL